MKHVKNKKVIQLKNKIDWAFETQMVLYYNDCLPNFQVGPVYLCKVNEEGGFGEVNKLPLKRGSRRPNRPKQV